MANLKPVRPEPIKREGNSKPARLFLWIFSIAMIVTAGSAFGMKLIDFYVTATREGTSELALALRRRRYEVVSLSSMLSQANRERALTAFRRGEFQMLVATDVAARGLDITDIDLVVNFDVPMHPEDYVHRIGRTGRAERTGKAVTLVCGLDQRRATDIERLLKEKIPRLELDGFEYRGTASETERPRGDRAGPGRRRGPRGDRPPRRRRGGGSTS